MSIVIEFSPHALARLRERAKFTKAQIEETVHHPDKVTLNKKIDDRLIYYKYFNHKYALQVVVAKYDNIVRIITFFPIDRKRVLNVKSLIHSL